MHNLTMKMLSLGFAAAAALPANAAEVYQISTISSLLAGGYEGNTTIAEMLRHGNLGLGTFNGVDGEMMVLDGKVYRGTTDGHAHLVAKAELTPFAEIVPFRPQGSIKFAAGQSLEQLQSALDSLPYSDSRIFVTRIDGHFKTILVRSEPKQKAPYRPLADVIKQQQVTNAFNDIDGTLIGFRFPASASSVNVAGWHFHFLSADKTRGGHVLTLTTGDGKALVEGFSDLRIRFPVKGPASSADAEAIKAVEHPQ